MCPVVAEEHGAQGKDSLNVRPFPAHAGLFESTLNDEFAARFDGTAADGISGLAVLFVVHAMPIVEEVGNLSPHRQNFCLFNSLLSQFDTEIVFSNSKTPINQTAE